MAKNLLSIYPALKRSKLKMEWVIYAIDKVTPRIHRDTNCIDDSDLFMDRKLLTPPIRDYLHLKNIAKKYHKPRRALLKLLEDDDG